MRKEEFEYIGLNAGQLFLRGLGVILLIGWAIYEIILFFIGA